MPIAKVINFLQRSEKDVAVLTWVSCGLHFAGSMYPKEWNRRVMVMTMLCGTAGE